MIAHQYVDYAFSGRIAKVYSIQGAMILNRIIWSLNMHHEQAPKWRDIFFLDGQWWMENTYEELVVHFSGLISETTIKKFVLEFEKDGLLISRQKPNSWDKTKWYTLDIDRWDEIHFQKKSIISHESSADRSMSRQPTDRSGAPRPISSNSHTNPLSNPPPSLPPSSPIERFAAGIKPAMEKRREEERSAEAQRGERGRRASELYESLFSEMSAKETAKFEENVNSQPDLTLEELERRIYRLASDPLLKLTTQSPNRIFHMIESEKWAASAKAEIQKIAQNPKIKIVGQLSPGVWARFILESQIAGRCKFAPPEDLLNACALISFGASWNELNGKTEGNNTEVIKDQETEYEDDLRYLDESHKHEPAQISGADFWSDSLGRAG